MTTAVALCLLFAGCLAWFARTAVLINTDELLTAERSREMLFSDSPWLVRFNFRPSFNKPPLHYWLTAGAFTVAGAARREAAVRFWPVVQAVLAAAATGWLASVLDPRRPWLIPWSVGIFVTCPLVLAEAGHARLDMGLVVCVTVAIGAVLRAHRGEGACWLAVAGVACAVGTLQKNPQGFLYWLLLVGACFALRPRPARRAGQWTTEAAVFLLAAAGAALWFVLQCAVFGMHPAEAFGLSEAATLTGPTRLGARPYLEIPFRLVTSWSLGAVALVAVFVPLVRRQDEPAVRQVSFACLAFVALAILSGFRSVRYVAPALPCLCVLAARWLWEMAEHARRWTRPVVWTAMALLTAVAFNNLRYKRVEPRVDAPAQKLAAAALGRIARSSGLRDIILVRRAGDESGEPGTVLYPAFYLFYGELATPVRESTAGQLRAQTSRTPSLGVCVNTDLSELRQSFPGLIVRSRHGGFVCWETP